MKIFINLIYDIHKVNIIYYNIRYILYIIMKYIIIHNINITLYYIIISAYADFYNIIYYILL